MGRKKGNDNIIEEKDEKDLNGDILSKGNLTKDIPSKENITKDIPIEAKSTKDNLSIEEKVRKVEIEKLRKVADLNENQLFTASDFHLPQEVISTGRLELDKILTPDIYTKTQKGGIPRGYVCEFFGPYSGGKTSLCQMLAGNVNKAGGLVLWLDAENSFIHDWAKNQGMDMEKTHILQDVVPRSGEFFLDKFTSLITTGKYSLAVIDSVAGLSPKSILESDLEETSRMGAHGAMWSKAMQKIVPASRIGNCAVILINQIRQKIGVYGNPETTPGGEAIKFYSVLRVRLSQLNKKDRGIERDGDDIGIRSQIQVVKSKFGPPFKECILPIYFTKDRPKPLDMLLDLALENKIIKTRTKKIGEETVHTFTLEGEIDLTGVKDIVIFKSMLKVDHAKKIYEKLVSKGVEIGEDLKSYIGSLDKDDPLGELI